MMEEKTMICTLVTPMFSYGAYQIKHSEMRITELKGIMRYTYRIISPCRSVQQLKEVEDELFGGAAESNESSSKHASPLRMLIRDDSLIRGNSRLLMHKKERNPQMECFVSGSFRILLRLNPHTSRVMQKRFPMVDLNWYEDLIELSLTLCGLGKRSRKGRGSVAVMDRCFDDKQKILEWILSKLNQFASICPDTNTIGANDNKKYYIAEDDKIYSIFNAQGYNRPVIQAIYLGKRIEETQVREYLRAVDKTCHDEKGRSSSEGDKFVTGGSYGKRFASSLLLSFIKTVEGIYPLYTFITPVCRDIKIERDKRVREQFIQKVETEANMRVRHNR